MEVNFKELTFKGERPLVFILSGAGLSAESGIPTFRDANGLWRKYDPKELASIGDTLKMFSTSTTKESRTLNPAALTRPI